MCDAVHVNIGEHVPPEVTLYRGFGPVTEFNGGTQEVLEPAFTKRGDHPRNTDGFSFRTTREACDERDHKGVFSITVAQILEINRGLEVRYDAADPTHVLIRNMPCIEKPNEMELANTVASELAYRARIVTLERNRR